MHTAMTFDERLAEWRIAWKNSSRPWPMITLTTETATYFGPFCLTMCLRLLNEARSLSHCCRHPLYATWRSPVGPSQAGNPLLRATSPSHWALGLGRRSWVVRSTSTMPNRGP